MLHGKDTRVYKELHDLSTVFNKCFRIEIPNGINDGNQCFQDVGKKVITAN